MTIDDVIVLLVSRLTEDAEKRFSSTNVPVVLRSLGITLTISVDRVEPGPLHEGQLLDASENVGSAVTIEDILELLAGSEEDLADHVIFSHRSLSESPERAIHSVGTAFLYGRMTRA